METIKQYETLFQEQNYSEIIRLMSEDPTCYRFPSMVYATISVRVQDCGTSPRFVVFTTHHSGEVVLNTYAPTNTCVDWAMGPSTYAPMKGEISPHAGIGLCNQIGTVRQDGPHFQGFTPLECA